MQLHSAVCGSQESDTTQCNVATECCGIESVPKAGISTPRRGMKTVCLTVPYLVVTRDTGDLVVQAGSSVVLGTGQQHTQLVAVWRACCSDRPGNTGERPESAS